MGSALLLSSCSAPKAAPPAIAAVPVLAASVERRDVPVEVRGIGSVESYSSVSVKTQITGELTGVYFREGDDVKKGQLLFSLDKRPYEAALTQAQAMLAHDQAQSEHAGTQAKRYSSLWNSGVVAKEQFDQMQADATAQEAAVAADTAAVENAKVQLNYCSIYSPIDGRTGNLMIHQGNMIKANDTPFLVTINQVEPIYVTYTVPEQFLGEIKQYAKSGKLKVEASIPGDTGRPLLGRLSFIDNSVDMTTGTIKLKGEFANTDRRLWPGQFVNVVLTLRDQPNATVVPAQAVQNGQQGQFVYVIKPDMTVESRPVTVSRTTRGQAVVESGVTPGERVVTDGQLRLVPGSHVEIREALMPEAQPNSQPQKAGGE